MLGQTPPGFIRIVFGVLGLCYIFPLIGYAIGSRHRARRPSRICRWLVVGYYLVATHAWIALLALVGDLFILLWMAIIAFGIVVGFLCMILTESRRHSFHDPFPTPESCRYCTTCKYDLAGNLSGTCPECGVPVPIDQWTAIRRCTQDSGFAKQALASQQTRAQEIAKAGRVPTSAPDRQDDGQQRPTNAG